MDDLLSLALILFLPLIAFLVAKWMDIYWRIKTMRRISKKDLHIVQIVSKDKKTITQRIFEPQQSIIWHDGKVWTVESKRIYRSEKPDDGFVMTEDNIRWREGIPILTVDDETFRPLEYDFKTPTNVKPAETGAILKSWEVNQAAKAALNAFKDIMQLKTLIYIAVGASVLGLLISGLTFTTVSDIQKTQLEHNVTINQLADYILPPEVRHPEILQNKTSSR